MEKFGGAIICTDCYLVVGWRTEPRLIVTMDQTEGDTMRTTCPTCMGTMKVTQVKTDAKGKSIKVTVKCPRCNGRGLVDS